MPINKFGKTPKDIICSKLQKPSSELISGLNSLFEESFYVPVYRDEERGDVLIDRPSPKIITSFCDGFNMSEFGKKLEESRSNNLKISTKNNLNQPPKKLAAYIGPISTSAVSFCSNFLINYVFKLLIFGLVRYHINCLKNYF